MNCCFFSPPGPTLTQLIALPDLDHRSGGECGWKVVGRPVSASGGWRLWLILLCAAFYPQCYLDVCSFSVWCRIILHPPPLLNMSWFPQTLQSICLPVERDEVVHMYGTTAAMSDEMLCVHSKVVLHFRMDGESPANILIVAALYCILWNWDLNTFGTPVCKDSLISPALKFPSL